jgi:small subunit ribosomal protein S15
MTVLKKEEIFKEFGKNKKDSGSSESQIALFTKRIESLSSHLKNNAKDFNTESLLLRWWVKEETYLSILRKQILKDTVK